MRLEGEVAARVAFSWTTSLNLHKSDPVALDNRLACSGEHRPRWPCCSRVQATVSGTLSRSLWTLRRTPAPTRNRTSVPMRVVTLTSPH